MKIFNIKKESILLLELTLTKKEFENAVALDPKCNKIIDEKGNTTFLLNVGECNYTGFSLTVDAEKDGKLYYLEHKPKPYSDVEKAKLAYLEKRCDTITKQIKETLKQIEKAEKNIEEYDLEEKEEGAE